MTVGSASDRTYTKQFWLLCFSSLLFFASFNMLIPELPAYLTSLGGAQHKGLIISLFTLTAMISRPFSGRLADTIGRVPVMIFGTSVCFVCSLCYPVLTGISGFLLLRLVHGFSTGFSPTGLSAYLSDIIPSDRRGEALGLMGAAGSVGMAAGPAAGGLIAHAFGLHAMFYSSSALALISVSILLGIQETLPNKQNFSIGLLRINYKDLFEPLVWAPCLVMVLGVYAYGAVLTVLPDYGAFMGINNKGVLFAYLTLASLVVRIVAGKTSDRFGRVPVLRASTLWLVAAMIVMAIADSATVLIVGVTMYGMAQGSISSTLLAWATDLSSEHHRGRGIASLYIAMEFGIGTGALASGLLLGNPASNFFIVFAVCAALGALAFLFLLIAPWRIRDSHGHK